MKIISNNIKGYLLALSAAVCWGVSGSFGQYLFEIKHLDMEWLVTVRLLISGLLLLSLAQSKKSKSIWSVWKSHEDAVQIILFGIAGMLAVQYTYFAAIKYSNAATATVLQYLGPVIIASYISIKQRQSPDAREIIAILFAITGTFLLVTHGNPRLLSISRRALFWGIGSAFALAFYSLQPSSLLRRLHPIIVIGWGMFIAGVTCSIIQPPWNFKGDWDWTTFFMVAFIILFATLGAFYAYLISIQLIGATKASLLACTEPISAALLAVAWLKTPFGIFDWTGTGLILITIVLLSHNKKPGEP